jgi:hypothetical protein
LNDAQKRHVKTILGINPISDNSEQNKTYWKQIMPRVAVPNDVENKLTLLKKAVQP